MVVMQKTESISARTQPAPNGQQRGTQSQRSRWLILCRNIGASILSSGLAKNPFSNRQETRKVIIDHSFGIALIRCSIHLLPIVVTIALAYLNLAGYFIGAYIGNQNSSEAQAGYFLLLQISAKTMELSIVASLGNIVLEIVRKKALSKDGIPLGLLSSGFRYFQISYFWSPAFLVGGQGISRRGERVLIMAALSLCGIVAIFAGPVPALLMIPKADNQWPAGGTPFWLIGTNETLWPEHLDERHVGGPQCLNPSSNVLETAPLEMSGCIWHGYTELSEGLKDRHFDWQSNITMNDGVVKRQFTRHQFIASGTESWTLGVYAATSRISRLLADEWVLATTNASSAHRNGRYSNLKNATSGEGLSRVQSWLPVVRTFCIRNASASNDSVLTQEFTALPEYDQTPLSFNSTTTFSLELHFTSGNKITTQWVPFSSILRLPSAPYTMPSAFMTVRIPYDFNSDGNAQNAALFACTVDARWALGDNIGNGLPVTDNMLMYPALKEARKPTDGLTASVGSFLPKEGPGWRTVSMDLTWLELLVPKLNPSTSHGKADWTTLAKSFTDAGFDNATGLVSAGSWSSLGSTIETTIATTVVDGMSRIGLSANGGNMRQAFDRYHWLRFMKDKTGHRDFDRLLDGRGSVLPPVNVANTSLTELRWSVTVAGLAYKTNGIAYYLALAVLFLHSLLALGHVIYMLVTCRSSDAWDHLEDLIVLSHLSRPPRHRDGKLKNTCGGIRYGATLRQTAKIRVRTDSTPAREEAVQLLLADEGIKGAEPDPNAHDHSNPAEDDHREKSELALVQADIFYGAAE